MRVGAFFCRRWQKKCIWLVSFIVVLVTLLLLQTNYLEVGPSADPTRTTRKVHLPVVSSWPGENETSLAANRASLLLNALRKQHARSDRTRNNDIVVVELDLQHVQEPHLIFNDSVAKPKTIYIAEDKSSSQEGLVNKYKQIARGPSCQRVTFSRSAQPAIALASWPGSGNTWLRHLIQQATGIYTGSIYYDKSLKTSGYLGEGIHGRNVLGIKTHEWPGYEPKINIRYDRAVLLLRHPGSALRSEFKRRVAGHTGTPRKSQRNVKDWRHFAAEMVEPWAQFQLHWIQEFSGPLHVVWYEQLKSKPWQTLQSLLWFLHGGTTTPGDQEALNCTIRHNVEGLFHRRASDDSFLTYSPELLIDLEHALHRVYTALNVRCPLPPNCGVSPYTLTAVLYRRLPLIVSCFFILYLLVACFVMIMVPNIKTNT